MKYLLDFNTKEAESVWNGLRFGSAARGRHHEVTVFLLGPGVEIESIGAELFDVPGQLAHFLALGGSAVSCGTCLHSRALNPAASCPISTIDDLLRLSEEADRVLTFG